MDDYRQHRRFLDSKKWVETLDKKTVVSLVIMCQLTIENQGTVFGDLSEENAFWYGTHLAWAVRRLREFEV